MKGILQWSMIGVCAFGLACGYGAKRITAGASESGSSGPVTGNGSSSSVASKARDSRGTATGSRSARSTLRSVDTLESVVTQGSDISYERLALWLLDADKDDIAAYWTDYKGREDQDRDTTDLIMISWTRIDPLGAVTAEKGTKFENFAWWAWASHDPRAALDAGLAASSDHMGSIAWGIGEFHPAWLREHFDEVPEGIRGATMQGLAKWGETDDPEATLDFLMKNGRNPPPEMLGHLVRQDPWAACEWIEKHADTLQSRYRYGTNPMSSLYKLLGESHPEVLEQLAAKTPSGETKRNMEAILFSHLLQEDLDAAIQQARTTEAPKVAIDRMGTVGLRLARKDPDRAFELAKQLFSEHPNALNSQSRVFYPNGSTSRGSGSDIARRFLESLVAADPARAMQTFTAGPKEPATTVSYTANTVSSIWAERNLEGFAQWVIDQDDPVIQKRSTPAIVGQLTKQHRYEEAADWAMSTTEDHSHYPLSNLVQRWSNVDRDAAARWIEKADIPEEQKATYRKYANPH